MGDKVWKIIGTVLIAVAGFAAKKATDTTWKAVMAEDAPDKPEEADSPLWMIVLFGALSGAIMAGAKGLAGKEWNKYYAKSTAHLQES